MNGLDIIKNKLTNISNKPGIYQYLNLNLLTIYNYNVNDVIFF